MVYSASSRIHEGLERIAERLGELQEAERELAAELDFSESRRREIGGQPEGACGEGIEALF